MGNTVATCLGQSIRVIHADGRVATFAHSVSVADLLLAHPHHFVCQASGFDGTPSNRGMSMLPLEMELKRGHTYFLLPLPSVLPGSPLHPPRCCERQEKFVSSNTGSDEDTFEHNLGSPLRTIEESKEWAGNVDKFKQGFSTKSGMPKQESGRMPSFHEDQLEEFWNSEMAPCKSLSDGHRFIRASKSWRPGLESISEDRISPHFLNRSRSHSRIDQLRPRAQTYGSR